MQVRGTLFKLNAYTFLEFVTSVVIPLRAIGGRPLVFCMFTMKKQHSERVLYEWPLSHLSEKNMKPTAQRNAKTSSLLKLRV